MTPTCPPHTWGAWTSEQVEGNPEVFELVRICHDCKKKETA